MDLDTSTNCSSWIRNISQLTRHRM